jgi:hypothetical protein
MCKYLQYKVLQECQKPAARNPHWDRYYRVTADRENWNCESGKSTLAVQGGILGGHKSAPVSHKHMLSFPSFSSPLINEDLPAGPQLVFTLNNRFFRHQSCYSLLPAKPGGQADRIVSLCKYKVVGNPQMFWCWDSTWSLALSITPQLIFKRWKKADKTLTNCRH